MTIMKPVNQLPQALSVSTVILTESQIDRQTGSPLHPLSPALSLLLSACPAALPLWL